MIGYQPGYQGLEKFSNHLHRWQLFNDIHNRTIRLTAERQEHLQTAYPEMTEALPRLADTLASPDTIVRSRTDATVELFYRHYPSTVVASKFLCIVVKALPDDNFIITAYYTDTIKQGEQLWEKP